MSDNITLIAAAAALVIIKRRRRRRHQREQKRKRVWCRDWLAARNNSDMTRFVQYELEATDAFGFRGFLRMTPELFNSLLDKITPHIQLQDSCMRDCITPHEMLVVTLRFLATGYYQ